MPVRKRGDRWYVRIQLGGQRIERSLGPTATKADALDYEARLRRDAVAGKLQRNPARTIDAALLRWLEGEAAQLKSYDNLLSKVRAIEPFAAGKSLAAIVLVAEEIKAAGIKAELSPATINRRLAILRRVANLAHDQWGWLDQPLGQRIKLLKGETTRHIYLTPDQVDLLATHCQNAAVATAIRLPVSMSKIMTVRSILPAASQRESAENASDWICHPISGNRWTTWISSSFSSTGTSAGSASARSRRRASAAVGVNTKSMKSAAV
jgi:hypothetical protein